MKETEEDLAQEIINSINKALEPIVGRNIAKEDIESVKKVITDYLLSALSKQDFKIEPEFKIEQDENDPTLVHFTFPAYYIEHVNLMVEREISGYIPEGGC